MVHKLHLSLLAAVTAAAVWSPPSAVAAEPLPYHNTCDDLSTVTVVDNGTRKWQTYNRGTIAAPNYVFRHQPNGTGATVVATATLWTPELAFEAGHAYEISVMLAVSSSQAASRGTVGLYSTPSVSASDIDLLGTVAPMPVKPSSGAWPVQTYYITADASTPRYLGVANRGGGNYKYFMVDDIKVREVDPMMPLAAEDVTTSVDDKSVGVSFKLPTHSVTGARLTGIGSVRLMRQGRLVKEWTDQTPGATVTFADEVSVIGTYTYTVVCANNGYDSPVAEAQAVVGPAKSTIQPTVNRSWQVFLPDGETRYGSNYMAPAVYVPGEGVQISWQPYDAGEGVDVTYTVTRVADGKVIADRIEATTVVDADACEDTPRLYTYAVKAFYGEQERDLYVSSTVSLHQSAPFLTAPSAESILEFSVIDGNHDMSTWAYASPSKDRHGVTTAFSTKVGNDLLISPGVDLKGGKTYRIDVEAFCNTLIPCTVGMSVVAGTSNTPEAMTIELVPPVTMANMFPRPYSAYYTPDEDTMMFFGVKGLNPGEREVYEDVAVSLFDILEVPGTLPESVVGLQVEYTSTPGVVNLRFDAPSKDVTGADLDAVTKIEVLCNGTVVKRIDNPTPGSPQVVAVGVELGSLDTYSVVPYTAAGAGVAQTVDVMILEPPYENYFDSKEAATGFTVLNPGQSGFQWAFHNNAMRSFPSQEVGHDSYMLTPPVHLEGGQFYKISFTTWLDKVSTTGYDTNEVELLIGTEPTVESLSTTIIPAYTVKGNYNGRVLLKEWFTVPETGEYYLAWHSKSPAATAMQIFVDDIMIGEKMDPTHPGGVTGLEVIPDAEGALKATVKFNLPENDLAGNPIEGTVYQWRLERDGSPLKNAFSGAPGSEVVCEDSGLEEGVHVYTVVCDGYFNRKASPSREVGVVAYVGLNRPGPVPFVTATETEGNYGEVTIEWDAPQTDYEGFKLNTSDITYTIGQYIVDMKTQQGSERVFETGYTGKSLTVQVKDDADSQDFCRFFVRPATARGDAPTTMLTRYMAVGKPYELPLHESFSDYTPSIAVMNQVTGDGGAATWGFNSVNPVTQVGAVDGDNGMALCEVVFVDGGARLMTGRVALDGDSPAATFWVYNQTKPSLADINLLALQVREGNDDFVDVERKTINDWACGRPGWQKASVDLSAYAGKVVYLGFDAQSKAYTFTHLDAVTIDQAHATDLGVIDLSHDKVYVGVDHRVKVAVVNHGTTEATGGKAILLLDGNVVETCDIADVAPGVVTEVVFDRVLSRDDIGRHHYSVEIEIAGDADMLDNYRTAAMFEVVDNDYPRVENLAAETAPDRVTLSWENPAIPADPQPVTVDFEDYDSWLTMATGIGDWTLLDIDNGGVGGFQNMELPNVPMYSNQSFILFDFSYGDFPQDPRYNAHSGDKVIASMYNADGSWTDDVLISPRLCGREQTISFWARGFSDGYRESFTLRYSTTTADIADFVEEPLARENNIGGEWTEFTYTLPEGARYFMIRHYNYGSYFLFLDDFTFTPEGAESLVTTGFNVYRDNVKVTDGPVAQCQWHDMAPAEKAVSYGVTAVYDRGESPMETVVVSWTGLDTAAAAPVRIGVDGESIVVDGAAGLDITVTAPSGLALVSITGSGNDRIAVGPGIYLVKAGTAVAKVAVK
ncbi:MAG: choice-of-anchor J domain-containing protein [Muribaculaceae bacterium]|nr:choice-of-anchor J domain-containing protein [Muribaculaceae bacterium]